MHYFSAQSPPGSNKENYSVETGVGGRKRIAAEHQEIEDLWSVGPSPLEQVHGIHYENQSEYATAYQLCFVKKSNSLQSLPLDFRNSQRGQCTG